MVFAGLARASEQAVSFFCALRTPPLQAAQDFAKANAKKRQESAVELFESVARATKRMRPRSMPKAAGVAAAPLAPPPPLANAGEVEDVEG